MTNQFYKIIINLFKEEPKKFKINKMIMKKKKQDFKVLMSLNKKFLNLLIIQIT